MQNLKNHIKEIFCTKIDSCVQNINPSNIELILNNILEECISEIDFSHTDTNNTVPLRYTTNENVFDGVNMDLKSSEFDLCTNEYRNAKNNEYSIKKEEIVKFPTVIPDDFKLSDELYYYAKSKHMQDNEIEISFEKFINHFKSTQKTSADWNAKWKDWVLNHNEFRNHLPRRPMNKEFFLDDSFKELAAKYISKNDIEEEFDKFKTYHIANGLLKANWKAEWQKWCQNAKNFKKEQKKTTIAQQKADYRWNFRQAKETSDRIKDWLEFDKGINWLDDFYWKGISIPGIGWQKVQHPDFNKEEIILYKIDSDNGQFMLNHKSDDIIDAEVLEND